ncbi:hypothetical protein [Desulfuromonas sp.]|uniref:hypothetical protein n=1 Tax=Desulfuromonas sp. TaxID=892 RepID=UPI0025B86705|nr:hypothetical protein [Desulfuromonas sp.]
MDQKKKILTVGIIAIILMGLYPPWTHTLNLTNIKRESPADYALLFDPPTPPERRLGTKIDTTRLLIQWSMVAFIVGGALFFTKEEN